MRIPPLRTDEPNTFTSLRSVGRPVGSRIVSNAETAPVASQAAISNPCIRVPLFRGRYPTAPHSAFATTTMMRNRTAGTPPEVPA